MRALVLPVIAVAIALLARALPATTSGLRARSLTDELTGCYDRRFLDAQLRLLTAAADRWGRPYAVLAVDLDGTKRINAAFGLAAGDAILRDFARTLMGAVRATDVVIRAGGDDFIVLLPDTELGPAGEVAQRLRAAFARRFGNVPEMAVGASIGVAEWRTGRTADDVLAEADRFLYAAKREGKGRVMCEPPATAGLRLMEA
jgi:diguanylate cyclase (GGDEF)-like protein